MAVFVNMAIKEYNCVSLKFTDVSGMPNALHERLYIASATPHDAVFPKTAIFIFNFVRI
jgi:hypothetical protein